MTCVDLRIHRVDEKRTRALFGDRVQGVDRDPPRATTDGQTSAPEIQLTVEGASENDVLYEMGNAGISVFASREAR